MLEPVYIDLSEVANEFFLIPEEIKGMSRFILANIADNYIREWEKLIDNNLRSTRNDYKRAIFSEQPDDYSVVIGLTPRESQLAMMLESGATPFDIKKGFKKSSKRKIGKNNNWYLTVPFRWATSEALGESGGFSNKMPKPIEKLVKVTKRPLKIGDLPSKYQKLGTNITSGYNHKFSIYEGLHRRQIGSGKENRGGYMTFRRVSEKSDKDGWVHPGFTPLNLMEKAFEQLDLGKVVDFSIDNFLAK